MRNKKGFILVETLIVAIFVTTVFMTIFTNVLPLLSEYNRISYYDDLNGKYAAHFMRRILIADSNWDTIKNLGASSYKELTCNDFSLSEECDDLVSSLDITEMYLIDFKTDTIKTTIPGAFSNNLAEYIRYMPKITTVPAAYTSYYSGGNAKRVIIVRTNEQTNESFYSQIEVVKP